MQTIIFDIDHTILDAERKLHDGVADLLTMLQTLGIQLAAVSNHDHRALVYLDEAGIRGFFERVLCSDHEPQPKTAAAMRRLLQKIGAQPHQTALVSHAHADILLGKDARLAKTIGVSHGIDNIVPLRLAGADHIVPDISAVLDVLE